MARKKRESDRTSENRIADPILTSGIGSRISAVADRLGGVARLAAEINFSAAQLYRVISGDSQAKIETVAAIANAGGVSIDWLATGREEARTTAQAGPAATPDGEALQLAIETVEEALVVTRRHMTPDKKAQMVRAVYDLFVETDGKAEKGVVLRLVKSAS